MYVRHRVKLLEIKGEHNIVPPSKQPSAERHDRCDRCDEHFDGDTNYQGSPQGRQLPHSINLSEVSEAVTSQQVTLKESPKGEVGVGYAKMSVRK